MDKKSLDQFWINQSLLKAGGNDIFSNPDLLETATAGINNGGATDIFSATGAIGLPFSTGIDNIFVDSQVLSISLFDEETIIIILFILILYQ